MRTWLRRAVGQDRPQALRAVTSPRWSDESCMPSKCYLVCGQQVYCSLHLWQANCRQYGSIQRRSWVCRPTRPFTGLLRCQHCSLASRTAHNIASRAFETAVRRGWQQRWVRQDAGGPEGAVRLPLHPVFALPARLFFTVQGPPASPDLTCYEWCAFRQNYVA
jgi:hypothetical protein